MASDNETTEAAPSCVVGDVLDGGRVERCSRDAVVVLLLGCVHEHLGETPLCQFHVREVADGWVWCPECDTAPGRRHRCRLEVLADVAHPGVKEGGNVRVLRG
ncbi:hypothetical protein [Planomonospora parontospora]|uniref:hypothetical protein n=1 Tax=Planomonospora parontospora TaxID=58119 RepID=UPI00195209A9|nr:hypothetical protein [Planomonospora parontospora]